MGIASSACLRRIAIFKGCAAGRVGCSQRCCRERSPSERRQSGRCCCKRRWCSCVDGGVAVLVVTKPRIVVPMVVEPRLVAPGRLSGRGFSLMVAEPRVIVT